MTGNRPATVPGEPGGGVMTMMFWYGGGAAFWQIVLMWIVMIGFWALLIWGAYSLFTHVTRRPDEPAAPTGTRAASSARQILDERLARGEIDTDEYRRLRDELESSGPRGAGTGAAHAH